MRRLGGWVSEFTITPIGGVVLLVLALGIVISVAGPKSEQGLGLVIAVVALLFIAGSNARGRNSGMKSFAERQAEFDGYKRPTDDTIAKTEEDAALWQRERERREGRERERPNPPDIGL